MCRCYGARGLDPVFHIVNIHLEPLGALQMHSRERLTDALVHTRPRHHRDRRAHRKTDRSNDLPGNTSPDVEQMMQQPLEHTCHEGRPQVGRTLRGAQAQCL